MLYVTTRNHQDAFTSNYVSTQNRGEDGGLFIPFHLPKLSSQDLRRLSQMSFGECVAEMLNLFFSEKLTGWDVEFSVGRYPVRMEQLAHKIFLTETWHNPDWQYGRLERNLADLLKSEADMPGNWVSVAIRMSILAANLGNQAILGAGPVDVACVSGDFTTAISVWYLRKMGFPIGNLICCCNENNQFWELFCNGQMRTDGACLSTVVPEADVVLPVNLERLISACGGVQETERYMECCRNGTVYTVSEMMHQQLRRGLFASVVSSARVEITIPNVYKTHNYVLSPASALAYCGLLDYRAKTGLVRTAMVLCDRSPVCDADTVSNIMDIPLMELKKLI